MRSIEPMSNEGRGATRNWSDLMRTAAITGAVIAALAAGAIATPTFARDYCHNNGSTGAIVGGLAGAAIGAGVAGHHNQAGGAVIGGLAGALAGNAIARSQNHCDHYSDYRNGGYYDNQPAYNGDYNNGYYDNGYYDNGRYGYNNYYAPRYYSGYNNGYYNNGYYPY
jgi:hypothetical protein